MRRRSPLRFLIFGLVALIIISSTTAIATTNTVPITRATHQTFPITANDIKPSACAAINLTSIVYCTGGNCNGTVANELILGTDGVDNINGKNGNDCILGGGGNDALDGDNGTDVCIGGAGTDTFGVKCETQIQ